MWPFNRKVEKRASYTDAFVSALLSRTGQQKRIELWPSRRERWKSALGLYSTGPP